MYSASISRMWKTALRTGLSRGQAMVEFAILSTLVLIVLVGGIQFALIGQAAQAVSQAANYAARYAAVNTSETNSTLMADIKGQISPTINNAGLTSISLNYNAADPNCPPNTTARQLGCQIWVTVTYNDTVQLVLGSSFLGLVFPTTLTATEYAMTE